MIDFKCNFVYEFFFLGNNWIVTLRCSLYIVTIPCTSEKINRYPFTLVSVLHAEVRSRTWRRARPLALYPSNQYKGFLIFLCGFKTISFYRPRQKKYLFVLYICNCVCSYVVPLDKSIFLLFHFFDVDYRNFIITIILILYVNCNVELFYFKNKM